MRLSAVITSSSTTSGSFWGRPQLLLRAGLFFALCCGLSGCGDLGNLQSTGGRLDWLEAKCDSTVRDAERKLAEIQQALALLPQSPSPNNQEICIGYHSEVSQAADTRKEYQIDLGTSEFIESVVVVPAHILDTNGSFTGYGFPKRFRIEVSDSADFQLSNVIADYTGADFPNPGRLPVAVETGGVKGRFLRFVATRLTGHGNQWFYALGEVFIFGSHRNLPLALPGRNITVSDSFGNPPVWMKRNAVDGQSGLGAAVDLESSPTLGWRAKPERGEGLSAWVCLDLGRGFPLDEVRIHPARTANPAMGSGFAFPKEFIVEGALGPEFSAPILLFESGEGDFPNPGANPVCVSVERKFVRYLRVTAKRLSVLRNQYECAFSEVEAFSEGVNVASGAPVTVSSSDEQSQWSLSALTDGFNSEARLVSLQPWLEGLSKRRELEWVQNSTLALLNRRRLHFRELLNQGAAIVGGALTVAGIFLWWRARQARKRELELLRQRIACDLHDEIGSNLGTIAMLSQMALESDTGDEQMRADICEISTVANQSVDAIRDLVWLLKQESAGRADFLAELRITAQMLLHGIEWEFSADENELPEQIPFDVRRNLFLAFKEILHNAAKHAAANRIRIALKAAAKTIALTIEDNGRGFDPTLATSGIGLPSLRNRAMGAGGRVEFVSAPNQGTTVHFELPLDPKR